MLSDFKKLMVTRFVFTFAVQIQAVILGWQMYVLTKDPLYIGLIGLAEAIPALGLALYAGYLVDRSRPLIVFRMVLGSSFLSAIVMFVSQHFTSQFNVQSQVLFLFLSSILTGTARAFSQPSMYAIVPKLIPRELLSKTSAWMALTMQTARISGPALGGILYGLVGISFCSGLVCLLLVVSICVFFTIRTKIPAPKIVESGDSKVAELLSGAQFVFNHPILLPALTLDMVSVFFGGVTALLPIYAAEILKIGATGLGILRAAPSVGAAISSYALTSIDIRKRAGHHLLVAVAGFGFCILVFAVSTNYWLSLVALALSGAFDSVSMVIRTAAVQLASPDSMRGRISAVNSIFIGSSNELGEFESGIAAKILGTVPAAIFGGVICLATVGAVSLFSPKLRNLNLNQLG